MKKLLAFIDRSWINSVLVFTALAILLDVLGTLVGATEITVIALVKSVAVGLVMGVLMYWVRKMDKYLPSKRDGKQ